MQVGEDAGFAHGDALAGEACPERVPSGREGK